MAKKAAKKSARASASASGKKVGKGAQPSGKKTAQGKGKKSTGKKATLALPIVEDVELKRYKKNTNNPRVKITGQNLRNGTPEFETSNPQGVTWDLTNIQNNSDNHIFVDAQPNFARRGKGGRGKGVGTEIGDLTITVDSSEGSDSEDFDVLFEEP